LKNDEDDSLRATQEIGKNKGKRNSFVTFKFGDRDWVARSIWKKTMFLTDFIVRKYICFLLILVAIYFSLAVSAVMVSAIFIDDGASLSIKKTLLSSGCNYIGGGLKPNPLRFDKFYLNLDYWLSDVKLKREILEDQRCMQILTRTIQHRSKLLSVAITNDPQSELILLKSIIRN